MTLRITFLEPDKLHPMSDSITIADLAIILESKYHLLEKFTDMFGEEILAYALDAGDENMGIVNEFAKNKWREFMLRSLHKIKSQAATEEHRTAFIQTKAYYQSVIVNCEFEKKEF